MTSGGEGEPLTHLDAGGNARMVDVGSKDVTWRESRAACEVVMRPETAALIAAGDVRKGDVLTVSRIAGIQAAKRTWELIPLCHQVALVLVDVELDVDTERGVIAIEAAARATDRTGVEMEALVAASVAALTIYDMVKAVDRGVTVNALRLLTKSGGTHGDWSAA